VQHVTGPSSGLDDVSKTTYTYDELGHRTSVKDGTNNVTRYDYDTDGNLVQQLSPLTTYWTYLNPVVGNFYTQYTYNALGHKASMKTVARSNTNAVTETWTYDYFGRLIQHTDLAGVAYTYTYDPFDRLMRQTSGLGYENGYDWVTNSSTVYPAQVGNESISYSYLANGWLAQIIDTHPNPGYSSAANVVNMQTNYQYDVDGNHAFERVRQNNSDGTYVDYQNQYIGYDALGRISTIDAMVGSSSTLLGNAVPVSILYGYDAHGNRIRVYSIMPASANSNTYNDWYQYDAAGRMMVQNISALQEFLAIVGGGASETNSISYDAAGNRTSVNSIGTYASGASMNSTSYTYSDYVYNPANQVLKTYTSTSSRTADGLLTSSVTYDLAGRMTDTEQKNYNTNMTLASTVDNHTDYNANGWALRQTNSLNGAQQYVVSYSPSVTNTTNTTPSLSDPGWYDALGNTFRYNVYSGSQTQTYDSSFLLQGDSEQLVKQTASMNLPGWTAGTTSYTFNSQGETIGIANPTDPNTLYQNKSYVLDEQGHILSDSSAGLYLYANGELIGKPVDLSSNWGLTPFDQNYTPISSAYPQNSPGAYTVMPGDTLASLALRFYGDSSFWYLIADANGLNVSSTSTSLPAGQTLQIPNQVTNVHNDSTTFKPYEPGEIIGNNTPKPIAPPPPPSPHNSGGFLAMIVVVVAAVVATIFQQYEVDAMLFSSLGAATVPVQLAVAAAVGDAAGQLAGNALGVQHGFSFKELATSFVEGGITGGLGSLGPAGSGLVATAERAAIQNVVGQGINVALGHQNGFSWSSFAASVVSAGVTREMNVNAPDGVHITGPNSSAQFSMADVAYNTLSGFVSGSAGQAVSVLVSGHGQINFASVAADSFGHALGNSIVGQIQETEAEKQTADVVNGLADLQQQAYASSAQATADAIQATNDQVSTEFEANVSQDIAAADGEQAMLYDTQAGFSAPNSPASLVSSVANMPLNIASNSATSGVPIYLDPNAPASPNSVEGLSIDYSAPGVALSAQRLASDPNASSLALSDALSTIRTMRSMGGLSVADDNGLQSAGLSVYERLNVSGAVTPGSSPAPELMEAGIGAMAFSGGGVGPRAAPISGEMDVLPTTTGNRALSPQQIEDISIFNEMTSATASGPIMFGQKGVSPNFSSKGAFQGASVQEVAAAISEGEIAPSAIQINTVNWNGQNVSVNNRSLTALSIAGQEPTNTVNVTNSISMSPNDPDNLYAFVQRLREMNYEPSPQIGVRSANNSWQESPAYFVSIPGVN
jgi:YD repeat-containing protein